NQIVCAPRRRDSGKHGGGTPISHTRLVGDLYGKGVLVTGLTRASRSPKVGAVSELSGCERRCRSCSSVAVAIAEVSLEALRSAEHAVGEIAEYDCVDWGEPRVRQGQNDHGSERD
ncbi:MAG: hypothetical protein JWR52_2723, partial [Marmoricola sp.]|nr:hypothetical protein [Marmoricola sp.]